jgi:valyl-tRNA synthetase
LKDDEGASKTVGWMVLEGSLKLLHPVMPFVTEELWQMIPHSGDSVVSAPWPRSDSSRIDETAERDMETIIELITGMRTLRGEFSVPAAEKAMAIVRTQSDHLKELVETHTDYILLLAKLESIQVGPDVKKPRQAATFVTADAEVYLPLQDLIDVGVEKARMERDAAVISRELEKTKKKLANQDFLKKAPPEVVEGTREKKKEFEEKLSRLTRNLTMLEE